MSLSVFAAMAGGLVVAFGMAGLGGWLLAKFAGWYSGAGAGRVGPWVMPPAWVTPLAVFLSALAVAWVTRKVARPGRTWVFAVGVGLVAVAASAVLALYGVLVEPVSIAVAALLTWSLVAAWDGGEAGRRKRLFREQLAGRVSDQTLAKLEQDPFALRLGGQSRGVAALAVRVLNEEVLRERLGAGRAVEICDELAERAIAFLLARGAYLEERVAGGARCAFGVVGADGEPKVAAVRASLELGVELDSAAAELRDRHGEAVDYGVGLECGRAMVGMFGKGRFQRLGILGPQPDRAWELAAANADYGSSVLVSAGSFAEIGAAGEFRPIALVASRGGAPEEIYELLAEGGKLGEMGAMRRDAFWRGVVRMRSGDHAAARQEFLDARAPGVDDRALERMIKRVAAELAGKVGAA